MTKKKITQLLDAESIVGEEEAKKIDAALSAGKVAKSDFLIELSDTEPTEEETAELIAEAEEKSAENVDTLNAEANDVKTNVETASDHASKPVIQESVLEDVSLSAQDSAKNVLELVEKNDDNIVTKRNVEKSAVKPSEKSAHPLQPVIDELLSSVDNSMYLGSDAERAELINPALQKLGIAIQDYVAKSNASPAPNENEILKDIEKLIQPLAESIKSLADEVGVLKAQYGAQGVKVENRIPQPRTISSQIYRSAAERPANKPLSTDEIARKSVGI